MRAAPFLCAALLSSGCVHLGDFDCNFTASREARQALDGVTTVRVSAEAGSLSIAGRDGLTDVVATGTACSSSAGDLAGIELQVERVNEEIVVRAVIPEGVRGRLDMKIEVPTNASLVVSDGSGSTSIRNVASVELEDGSGSVSIADVAGDVKVKDGSGSLEVVRIGGSVTIDDGSGSMDVLEIAGDIEIADGSGSISVFDVARDVTVVDDGSGAIDVTQVDGSVLVSEKGSGSIAAHSVKGDLTVKLTDASVRHSEIGGTISVPRE